MFLTANEQRKYIFQTTFIKYVLVLDMQLVGLGKLSKINLLYLTVMFEDKKHIFIFKSKSMSLVLSRRASFKENDVIMTSLMKRFQ